MPISGTSRTTTHDVEAPRSSHRSLRHEGDGQIDDPETTGLPERRHHQPPPSSSSRTISGGRLAGKAFKGIHPHRFEVDNLTPSRTSSPPPSPRGAPMSSRRSGVTTASAEHTSSQVQRAPTAHADCRRPLDQVALLGPARVDLASRAWDLRRHSSRCRTVASRADVSFLERTQRPDVEETRCRDHSSLNPPSRIVTRRDFLKRVGVTSAGITAFAVAGRGRAAAPRAEYPTGSPHTNHRSVAASHCARPPGPAVIVPGTRNRSGSSSSPGSPAIASCATSYSTRPPDTVT